MTEPSSYELNAWRDIQLYKGRPITRAMTYAGEQMASGVANLSERAGQYLDDRPLAQSVVARGQAFAAKSAQGFSNGARVAKEAIPDGVADWSGAAAGSVRQMGARVSRVGLSADAVVKKHKKRGHDVGSLYDVRRLDLQHIDAAYKRASLSVCYPLGAAISGGAAAFVISGGAMATAVSAGAAAAPSGATILGAIAADAAAVLGLASRSVGHVALRYGYDPEEPAEKLFVMSVVNAGTAMSASAKTAAMADISRLTQALYRGKTWAVLLDKSLVARVSKRVAEKFIDRLTKKGLGKLVPGVGIVLGSGFNWATLEGIVDVADLAYRRRFLLDKYPHLGEGEESGSIISAGQDSTNDTDEVISVLDELDEEGGPDLI